MTHPILSRLLSTWIMLAATPAAAQGICTAPIGPVDPCVAGHWIGTSSAPSAIEERLRSLGDVHAAEAELLTGIAMVVRVDGFTHTRPIGVAATAQARDPSGPVFVDAILGIGEEYSWMSASGGEITGCLAGAPADISGHVTIGTPEGSVSDRVSLPELPGGGGPLSQRYTCTADRLEIAVDLPGGLGTVYRDFVRVSARDYRAAE